MKMLKKLSRLRLCLGLALLLLLVAGGAAAGDEVYFSPNGNADEALEKLFAGARSEINAAVYIFTSRNLASAVLDAHKRGVKVRIILDGNDESDYSKGFYLRRRGVDLRYARGLAKAAYKGKKKGRQKNYGLMHHKFAVVDGSYLATGSYNWTASAEKWNRENLLILKSRSLARRYNQEFEKLWQSTFRK